MEDGLHEPLRAAEMAENAADAVFSDYHAESLPADELGRDAEPEVEDEEDEDEAECRVCRGEAVRCRCRSASFHV